MSIFSTINSSFPKSFLDLSDKLTEVKNYKAFRRYLFEFSDAHPLVNYKIFKEKAINAANDTNTDNDRANIQKELNQYMSQIEDNAAVTFNGKSLLDGTQGRGIVADP